MYYHTESYCRYIPKQRLHLLPMLVHLCSRQSDNHWSTWVPQAQPALRCSGLRQVPSGLGRDCKVGTGDGRGNFTSLHNLCWSMLITWFRDSSACNWSFLSFFQVIVYECNMNVSVYDIRLPYVTICYQESELMWIGDPGVDGTSCKQGTVSSSGLWRRPVRITPVGIWWNLQMICQLEYGYWGYWYGYCSHCSEMKSRDSSAMGW